MLLREATVYNQIGLENVASLAIRYTGSDLLSLCGVEAAKLSEVNFLVSASQGPKHPFFFLFRLNVKLSTEKKRNLINMTLEMIASTMAVRPVQEVLKGFPYSGSGPIMIRNLALVFGCCRLFFLYFTVLISFLMINIKPPSHSPRKFGRCRGWTIVFKISQPDHSIRCVHSIVLRSVE